MDIAFERSYPTPLSNSTLLPLLLLSLARQKHSPRTSTTIKNEYDYIVVGGGAAGSVVASRLSEDPHVKVLLLEAGHDSPCLTEVPEISFYYQGTDVDWKFKTVRQKHAAVGLRNRQINWTVGKMLGGSSNHNEMLYIRGNKKDFNDWAAQGAKGWSYKEVFPYFLKLENNTNPDFLANGYHAVGGPMTVESSTYFPLIKKALYASAKELGCKFLDVNAERQTGVFDYQRNVRDKQRCSSVKGYLVPAENRKNLDILLNAMATKVVINEGQATGVEFYHDCQYKTVNARMEVVLSAGTVKSPQLLMLSGIGPRKDLKKLNIPVVLDLPVGKNFQDHAAVNYLFLSPGFPTLAEKVSSPSNIHQYIKNREGPLSESFFMAAFLNAKSVEPCIDFPNFSFQIVQFPETGLASTNIKPEVFRKFIRPYKGKSFLTCHVELIQPKSYGKIFLNSSDPFDSPSIDPNYFAVPSDLGIVVEGLKACKRLFSSDPVSQFNIRPFTTPLPGCEKYQECEDAYLRCYAKTLTSASWHGVGTCKMGDAKDITTVVDPELRVKGIRGLRVVDASIMPRITSGNTHIPTIMIAEKASDMIKKYRLEQEFPRACKD